MPTLYFFNYTTFKKKLVTLFCVVYIPPEGSPFKNKDVFTKPENSLLLEHKGVYFFGDSMLGLVLRTALSQMALITLTCLKGRVGLRHQPEGRGGGGGAATPTTLPVVYIQTQRPRFRSWTKVNSAKEGTTL